MFQMWDSKTERAFEPSPNAPASSHIVIAYLRYALRIISDTMEPQIIQTELWFIGQAL